MKLYLVQHGIQNEPEVDPEKGLSYKGVNDIQNLGAFLQGTKISVPEIYHSPKKRARETAEILAEALDDAALKEIENITPMDPVDPLADEVNARDKDLMVVGHLPYLGKLSGKLLADDENADMVAFEQGGCAILEKEDGKWRLGSMITPDMVW